MAKLDRKKGLKSTAANEASRKRGCCPLTVLWEFGSAPPARTFVNLPPA